MVKRLIILLLFISNITVAQTFGKEEIKDLLKFSTFYAAVNGGTSLSDVDVFSVDNGLSTQTISTPYDYNFTIGLRKIARFGYENKAQTFYDGTESNYSDAATVGKIRGVEYLFEIDSVDLSFREEALKSIAKRAIARKTGARGLRSILEDILMDVMFELPNEDLEKVIIDENSADNGSEPIKVFKTPKKKSSAS